ncbi:hypothetical protein R75465_02224 [Paraburkholderia aspalathi]|uniref:hypothetical protein n=1 Tax=Paraburkholderia aspalathi TaxID=1324617 RepID=UPI001B1142B7|nr:hypothetical protein [Paraburkholderia aspalathi]CAE6739968.1 hypothetical protein R75465_02224 [Paraburkholderia aspalathi]
MQATLPFVKPVAAAERPYALRYRIDGVRAELNFTSDDARAVKAAELINSRVAVVFLPSQP